MFAPGMKLPVGLAAGGGATFVMSIFLGWYGFPKFLQSQISNSKMLKPGSDTRTLWASFPDPIDFKIYLFNVTNPEDVHTGETPIMQEVGPYFFGEYKMKENLADNMEEDTVSYSLRTKWVFFPEKSNGLTGNEIITMPHPLIVGMVGALERTKPGMLGLIGKALPHIYRNPEHAFVTAKAMDLMFHGVLVNCSVTDFSAKAVCGALKKEGKDFHWVNDKEFTFSFFGHKNNTLEPWRLEVKRGIRNVQELGLVTNFKGKPKMSVWRGDPCNDLLGTDSTIFPPFLKKEDGITAFAPDLCRSITAKYERDISYQGIPGYRYSADLGDQSSVPEEKCYCAAEGDCMKKGVMDLFPCQGSPVVASLPHFYLAHDDYQRGVKGLNPTQSLHEIEMQFEPMTGTPLEARKRLQFNLPMHAVDKVALLANVPTTLVPLFWVEEGLALPDMYVKQIQSQLIRALKILGALKWILMATGAGLGGAGGFLLYKKKQEIQVNSVNNANKVTNVSTLSGADLNGMSKY